MGEIIYRKATIDDWDAAMSLAWKTFLRFEAPEYTQEGVENFQNFISDDTLRKMFVNDSYQMYVAMDGERLVGMITLRDMYHISLLFVDEEYHKQGIGSKLIMCMGQYVKSYVGRSIMTVNAAPYAEGFYHRIGFIYRGLRTVRDGITYTPMELLL